MTLIIDKKSLHPGMKIPKSLVEQIKDKIDRWKSFVSLWVSSIKKGPPTSSFSPYHVSVSGNVREGFKETENIYTAHYILSSGFYRYCDVDGTNFDFNSTKPYICFQCFILKTDDPFRLEYEDPNNSGSWNLITQYPSQGGVPSLGRHHWITIYGQIMSTHFKDNVAHYRIVTNGTVTNLVSMIWEVRNCYV